MLTLEVDGTSVSVTNYLRADKILNLAKIAFARGLTTY